MLATIFSAVGAQIIDSLLGKITGLFEAYFKKQVSMEELRTGLARAMLETFAEVEKAHADLIAKTFESFQQTLRQSVLMQRMWAWVVATQLAVLLWHQVGIPAFVHITGDGYPSSGSTVEWAYALIGFLFGAGAMMLRAGPGSPWSLKEQIKGLVR
jgi:hypothetical protein